MSNAIDPKVLKYKCDQQPSNVISMGAQASWLYILKLNYNQWTIDGHTRFRNTIDAKRC
ncbi:MAG: hypothetical protein ACHQ1D_11805 [Nitrososphaerales archaeon]